MFSGTIFSRCSEPPEDARLPRSYWAFYDHVDGSTPTAAIADSLDLSREETFAAVHALQTHGLIEEVVVTYETYRATGSGPAPASHAGSPSDGAADRVTEDAADPGAESTTAATPTAGASADETASTKTPSSETPSSETSTPVGTGGAPSGDGSAPAPKPPSLYPDDAHSTDASAEEETGENTRAEASMEGSSAGDAPSDEASEGEGSSGEARVTDASSDEEEPTQEEPTQEEPTQEEPTQEEPKEEGEPSGAASSGLHLPSFWTWLEEHAPNVKEYKNTQAFILMETSGPLSRIGIDSMDDLQELERCDDPEVVEALEAAVENNLNESIPSSCYQ